MCCPDVDPHPLAHLACSQTVWMLIQEMLDAQRANFKTCGNWGGTGSSLWAIGVVSQNYGPVSCNRTERGKKPEAATRLAGAFALPGFKMAGLALPWFALGTLGLLTLFLLKAAAFTFGWGLAIVPFLHEGVVDTYHWLNERQIPGRGSHGHHHARSGGHHGHVRRLSGGWICRGSSGILRGVSGVVFNVVIGRYFLRHR